MTQTFGSEAIFNTMALTEYLVDAGQRSILFWDVMRQRGNQYLDRPVKDDPHVLQFAFEPVVDGRTPAEPVNYRLVKIVPPDGVTPEDRKRPFVVVDPRGGHGPGIVAEDMTYRPRHAFQDLIAKCTQPDPSRSRSAIRAGTMP